MDEEKVQMNKNTADEQEQQDVPEEVGDIRVADEVISIVASLAAQEVPGVLSMSGGLTDGINHFLGKENASKGVRLSFEGKLVTASVFVNIEYGSSIPEVALEIQEKVKDAIEKMTGYEVQFVDVHVQGVAKREKTDFEKVAEDLKASLDEETAEDRHKKFFEED